ncbi:hypothetical protein JTB14_023343 [Gonioctena quinquepunctata]|nr:hypothetical protein JTB14_023343 [Gonioctena quinquepunctata]
MNNTLVNGAMRRDRSVQIMHVLEDKVWKLRPFINKQKSKYVEHYQPEKHFIRGEPIRFGYEMWALNTTYGYLVDCELYQGKNSQRSEIYEKEFGKAAAPFVTMLDRLRGTKDRPYELYSDNLFTGLNLLQRMEERGYQGTGTVRENRIPKNYPMSDKKTLTKKERVNIMGGTDLMDENLSRYRIGIRSKKWWWPIFTWFVDVTVTNAWQIHRKSGGKLMQLEFRREIAICYLKVMEPSLSLVGDLELQDPVYRWTEFQTI